MSAQDEMALQLERYAGLAWRAYELGEADLFEALNASKSAHDARRETANSRLAVRESAARLLLTGCAWSVPVVGGDQSDFAGTLILEWVQPQAIEIQLDGMTYAGVRTSHLCTTDACRGKFRNIRKIYRRHIHHGEADLTAKNDARMHCEWVSYFPEVDGQCRTQDGRLFKLHAAKPVPAAVSSP